MDKNQHNKLVAMDDLALLCAISSAVGNNSDKTLGNYSRRELMKMVAHYDFSFLDAWPENKEEKE